MKHYSPLSKSQYGLYVECINHTGEICYNLTYLYVLDGTLDEVKLQAAIESAVAIHPTLFTRIELNEQGDPVQTIDESETFSLQVEHVADIEVEKQNMVVPFDIYHDRLFHIRLLKDAEHFYLLLDIHHIICDGSALKVILSDIEAAYNGKALKPETLTMMEVAKAEAEKRQTPVFEESKQWYAQYFDCGDCYSPLLPDKEEAEPQQDRMTRIMHVDGKRLDAFCREHSIYKSTFFTAVYSYLLAMFNNEQEVLFNTIYSGRTDKRLEHSIGMLVKTLPVYATFTNDTTVLEFLNAGQKQMTGCRQHETYSFSDIMSDLHLQIASFFAWHGMVLDNMEMCGKPTKAIQMCNTTLEVPLYVKALIIDGHYCVEAEYKSNVYSQQLISQFLESYEAVVEGFLQEEYLRNIAIATKKQVELLDGFNATDVPYDDTQTIVSLFRRQVKATPENIAVVYKEKKYTYAEVDAISDRIAGYIVGKGLGLEDVVSVLIPRCEWMAIASMGVLKARCTYQPLDPSYPKERLNFMMQDASAKLLIADEELYPIVDEYQGDIIFTKDLTQLPAAGTLPEGPKPESLFILLYTSGSTGVPKGCQLEHRNLVTFCHWYQRYYGLKSEHNVAAYASYGFDACMMDMYPALTCGASVYIIPEELRLDLIALNDYFEQNRITHSFMTTQVGYQFATSIENHSLLHLSTGGEKLASLTPPTGYDFYNVYGPTECTIFTTTYLVDKKLNEIPIGKPLDNMHLYIVDPHGHRLPIGAAGELWISSPQVSRGYLNRPEKTAEVFIGNPFASSTSGETGKYTRCYRTGDIVRYLPSGDIQFVGRRDGQVKIRGFRIELKEVESVIREFPGIKDATVQAFDVDDGEHQSSGGGKFIVAYIVSDEQVDVEALNNFILDQKPPYMVPAVTMQIEAIPLNQNQKVNKKALPKPVKNALGKMNSEEFAAAPLNNLEKDLKEIIAGIVNTTDFGITTLLSHVGLTSIAAIKLAVQINKHYGVTLDSKTLVKSGTLQSIENEIWKGVKMNGMKTIVNGFNAQSNHSPEIVPLSYAQTGVYIDCVNNPTSTVYNIPFLLSFPTDIEPAKLSDAVKQVAEAHPELSVHFTTEGNTIMQSLRDSVPVEVPVTEMSDLDLDTYKREFVRPFNLQQPPLYRFEVVKTESGVKLLIDVHHLVFDGGSADLFIRQICSVLDGSGIEKETYTYFDFVADQQKAEDSDDFKAAQQFFVEKLQNLTSNNTLGQTTSASEIPADLQKTGQQGFVGEGVCPVDHDKVTMFCRQQGITSAHLFLAATSYVVSRYTNSREVYLSTISSGRSNLKIADTVGMFVNTLALGLNIDDVTISRYLKQVSENFDETLRHEDYPFARIASDFGFRPAIFFAYQVGVLSEYTIGGHPIGQEMLELNVPKFKINIVIESRGVVVQYDDSLYSARLGNALAESIVAVAEQMIAQPQAMVRKISIISKNQEKELSHLRQMATGEAPFKFFHECISHFAQEQPEQEALVACDATYTYKEMDELTNRIANGLLQRGIKSGDRVALLLPRTSRLILSMFGVMKAGAAYIPCAPDYPEDRVKLILEDSEAKMIITPELAEELLQTKEATLPQTTITPDNLAYLIYTSGSTGRPKGVMLRHEGICNYLYGHPANVFANAVLTDAMRILSVTTISFDAALQDIGMAYYNGKTLILATEEQANNPLLLAQLIREQHIDMVSGTPSRWQTWLTSDDFCQAISGVRICRAGGEKYPQQLLDQLRTVTKARLFNCYGPTEITVASNNAELTNGSLITVGKPQLNVKEFIVDADGNELPIGVVGELYIGGKGVARGYNNLNEMTCERFIDYHGERIYKSGDYAKWLPDGNVIILGRTDHQIKLRGLRIELGEIESVILQVEGVNQVVVIIRQIGGMEHLCAYFTADRKIDIDTLRTAISSHLTDYMVPTAYMQLDRLPMTPNGKTDLKALPDPQVQTTQCTSGAAASRKLTRIEKELQGMVKNILGVDDIDVECSLGMVGLTSLSAIRLAVLIQQRYGVTLQAKQMVKNSSLMSIEDEIVSTILNSQSTMDNGELATQKEPDANHHPLPIANYPLSYAQTGVYFDCLKNPTAIQYNIPQMVTFPKNTDTGTLLEAVRTLVAKHPQLTAHFEQTEEGIMQTVDPGLSINIPMKTMSEDELQQSKHDFVRPFDLATGPLCRFEIVSTPQAVRLLFDVHHLVFDGGSTDVFFRQLCDILNGTTIEDEIISYPAYVMAEKAAEDGEDYQKAKDFFKERLSVVEAATEVRPDLPDPKTGTVSEAISALDIKTIEAFCRAHQITPAHLTLSAVYYALSRFANSEQVCITTVSNGRSDLRIRNTVGMFVNTLAMTATIDKQSVREFLQEVSDNFDETLSHENYPFAQIAADYSLMPEIQFVYQLGITAQYTVGGTSLEMEVLGTHTPKFPITFFIATVDGQPSVCVAYDNGKYSARLMQSLADAVKVTIERMVAKPDANLTSISIVSDEEAKRIIKIGTGKEIDVDLSKTFANLFTEQAKRTPDAPAVVDRDSQLTYGEMDRYSNALAHQLIDFGVQPNDFVCVMLDRFKEFPLAVLAIHKAGAAYTPLDFEYPNERLSYMLENSESKLLITSHNVLEAKQAEGDFRTATAKTFFIDDFMAEINGQKLTANSQQPIDLSSPDGLAYMIYTSGSTGKPKGAMLHQAGLRNFIAVVIDMEQLTAADHISGHRSFSFDAHIEDMYPVLTLGGSFHIMPTEIRKDLAAIRKFLFDHQITGGGYSTAMTCLLLNTFDDLPIRFTTGGGEKMDGVYSDHIEIINVYGPTECTDDTSYYSIAPCLRVENIPIGQSVANNWNFIVDSAGNLVPQGVAGELCFAGVQVGRGYWRLPERTAKSFVDCPFVKVDRWGRPVRMYHTGDLCRWNEDGQIEYMGRIDTQVKLRGFRIELGEIESKALNIDDIRQAAAEVRKVQGNEHLLLYYTVVDGSSISDDDLLAALKASSLAEYMVPDVYMQMDVMPMTPNGKINRKALPAPELQRTTEYEAPKGKMEELFCTIFSDILKIQEVGATDNFFEIGGTSINAIKVIVEASKHGVQIVFNDLFNLKTPRALAAFVSSGETATVPAASSAESDVVVDMIAGTPEAEHYAPLNALLASNTLATFREGKRQTIGDVLLTGATGYLGIHVLNELLTNYHGKILCPVRAKGNDEALSRIKTLYFYYFGRTEAFSHFDERVTAFAAEVTEPNAFDSLSDQLTVVNCVANVKHFSAGNDIEMVNIESVRHLISFCLRTGSRLIHISTNSIAGLSIDGVPGPDACLTEQDFYIGQHVSDRKYTYSKFKAEELVLDAIAHHGINAKIMRVGNLSARQKDGEFQINFNTNNFLALLRAFVVIGMVPYEVLDQRFEFSPIDEVARAIMLLAQTSQECVVFHPYNTHRQFLSDVLDGFAQAGITLKRVETNEFSNRLNNLMDNPDIVTLLRPLMAYNLGGNRKIHSIETTNDYTTQVLYRLGFQWPPTAADYVHRFVDTIVGFDYFTV